MEEHYIKFRDSLYELFNLEKERLKVEFEEGKNYTESELSDIISYAEKDLYKASEWFQEVSKDLRELWNGESSAANQDELNAAYKLIATKISIRKGGPLKFEPKEIDNLTKLIIEFDKEFSTVLKCRFTFLRSQFSSKVVGLDGDTTINLRIEDAISKCWSFFGSSLASFIHLLRNCSNSNTGLLSRLILSRALFEIAIHNIYITRKLKRITIQIEGITDDKSIEKLELFNNHFLSGMFGSKSPETDGNFPNPFNILTCIKEIQKESIGEYNFEIINEFYSHLCDYAHPNYLMRNSICEVGPAKGDAFSYEVFIDKEATGDFNANKIFHYLLQAINYSVEIFKTSFDEMNETFDKLKEINKIKGAIYQKKLKEHFAKK